jgi:uncharacterized protein (TIGR03067 family)
MRVAAFALFAGVASLVVSGGPAVAAPVPKHLMKEAEGDLVKLQGKWKIQSLKMGEMDLGGDVIKSLDMVLEFRGDAVSMTMNAPGSTQKMTATVKLDANARRMTMTNVKTVGGNGQPVQNAGTKENEAGYAIDGDKLLIAAGQSGPDGGATAADPKKPGPNTIVLTFARVKE